MINARDSKPVILLCFVTFAFMVFADTDNKWRLLSKYDDLELDQKLKLINKPAIKSFRTEYGDIVDCVDIHKQLAFDHPLLRNHKIQMKPTLVPKRIRSNTSVKETPSVVLAKNIRCPVGTVAVKRAGEEDFLMAKHFSSLRTSRLQNKYSPSQYVDDPRGVRNTVVEFRGMHYGTRGNLNIWSPNVTADQFSMAMFLVSNSPSILQAGWAVNQYLYNNYSRLFTYWTVDGYETGCFNLLCAGFVQVSSEIPLGLIIFPISVYGDRAKQYFFELAIFQDPKTLNWWLVFGGNKPVGYWPSAIVPGLKTGADNSAWGGIAYSRLGEKSPAMGSGHFPEKDNDYAKAAYISGMSVVDESHSYVDPDMHTIHVEEPQCYDLKYSELVQPWGHTIFYGGPGNCDS